MRREFARFLVAGASNTLFGYLLYLLLLSWLGYMLAYSVAYCAGIVLSYFLNARFVFRERVNLASFLKFPLVYVVQYSLGALLLWLLAGKAGVRPSLAMIAVIIATIPVTFITSRLILKKNRTHVNSQTQ